MPGKFTGVVDIPEYTDVENSTRLKISFTLALVNEVDIGGAINHYCSEGSTETRPTDAVSVVNTILGKFENALTISSWFDSLSTRTYPNR